MYRIDRFRRQPLYRLDPEPPGYAAEIELLVSGGGRNSWSHTHDLIAFDSVGGDGYTDVWTIRPDGTGLTAITSAIGGLPTKHVGNPAWSPDGVWLLVQVMEQSAESDELGFPGIGYFNALWAIRWSDRAITKLTDPGVGLDRGALHAAWSDDGTTLVWVRPEANLAGEPPSWYSPHAVMTAEFVVAGGVPSLQNAQTHYPLGAARKNGAFESHGWDGASTDTFFFRTNNLAGNPRFGFTLCRYTISTGEVEIIVDSQTDWSEFIELAPNGEFYVFGSTLGNDYEGDIARVPHDLWLMAPDLTARNRLTDVSNPEHANFAEMGGLAGATYALYDFSMAADSTRLVARGTRHEADGTLTRDYGLFLVTITEGI